MSRVPPSNQAKTTLAQLAERVRKSNAPVEIPVCETDIVVVALPPRDYERWRAIRAAAQALVTRPRQRPEAYRAETLRVLRRYERKYKMTSAEFYRRFQTGELPEGQRDYFDWRVRYNTFLRQTADAQRQSA